MSFSSLHFVVFLLHYGALFFLLPLNQQACFINAEDTKAKKKEVVLFTEEVKYLETSVGYRESLEGSFLTMSSRHPAVPEELSDNVTPSTHMHLQASTEDNGLVHSSLQQELQQWRREDLIVPQKANVQHLTHLLPNQKSPTDPHVLTHKDFLKVDLSQSTGTTEVTASLANGDKTASVSSVPSKEVPAWEAKLLPTSTEGETTRKGHISLVPQEKKLVFSLETSTMKKVSLSEQKLKSSEDVWRSTTTIAVVAPSSEDQRRVGSALPTEAPQSGLSCSGSSH